MTFMPAIETLGRLAGLVPLLCGVVLLRRCWRQRDASARTLAAGWGLILAGVWMFARAFGVKPGIASGLLALSLIAFAVIAVRADVRQARRRKAAPATFEPEPRRTDWMRAGAKAFLAVVLSGFTAIGLGVAFAVAMPLGPHDRIVIGGVLVPVLWGAGMAWTLSDARLARATAALLAASVFGYGIAFLPKVMG